MILARAGSKGLPDKNIRLFNGVPLLGREVSRLKSEVGVSKVVVSSDSQHYLNIAQEFGADHCINRPTHLSDDMSGALNSIVHALTWLREKSINFDKFLLHQITSPLWNSIDLENVVKLSKKYPKAAILTTSTYKNNPLYVGWMKQRDWQKFGDTYERRQDVPEVCYINGAFYYLLVSDIDMGLLYHEKNIKFSQMPEERSVDIDTKFEFILAEYLDQEKF